MNDSSRAIDDGACRALWSAVLIQAIRDLDGKYQNERFQARQYVFFDADRGPGSFDWVCYMLDLNPEALRTIVMSKHGRSRIKDKNRNRGRSMLKVCESEAAKLGQSREALAIGICATAIRAKGK